MRRGRGAEAACPAQQPPARRIGRPPSAAAASATNSALLLPLSVLLPPQFVYLKEAFSPSLDERIGVLFDSFAVDGRLVVNYALTPAWG